MYFLYHIIYDTLYNVLYHIKRQIPNICIIVPGIHVYRGYTKEKSLVPLTGVFSVYVLRYYGFRCGLGLAFGMEYNKDRS